MVRTEEEGRVTQNGARAAVVGRFVLPKPARAISGARLSAMDTLPAGSRSLARTCPLGRPGRLERTCGKVECPRFPFSRFDRQYLSPPTTFSPNVLRPESLYNGVVPSSLAAASLLQTLKRIHHFGKEVRVP